MEKLNIEGNPINIVPSSGPMSLPVGKRHSISSSSKFEIRKLSDTRTEVKFSPDNRSPKAKLCYRMADLVMMLLIVFPLSIGFWRGVWALMRYYSEVWGTGPWLSMGLGYLIPFVLYLYQEPLKRYVVPGPMNFIPFYIISRFLLLIHSFGSVNQWRGLWQMLDDKTGLGPHSALVCLVVGIFFNLIFRTFSNVLAPPLLCCVDEAFTIHDCPLRFKTPPEQKWRYFLDCAFSVFVIPSLTVLCWRGVWNMADYYLYPEDPVMSALSSLGFGYILCIVLCSAQPFICEFVCSLKGLVRLSVIDLNYLLGFIGCVFAWRGVWNMYDQFIIFDTPNLSEWVTTIVGMIGPVLFGCVSTVMVRGIAIDGEMDEDEAAEWLIPYISHLRTTNNEVPFPEPWLCRYLFTSQKMNCDKAKFSRHHRTRPKKIGIAEYLEGVTQPLKEKNNVSNSHYKGGSLTDSTRNNPTPRVQLSQIPHMDSSSEEELGAREMLNPNPELDEATHNEATKLQEVVAIQQD